MLSKYPIRTATLTATHNSSLFSNAPRPYVSVPKRSFFFNSRGDLDYLYEQAERFPNDVNRQAELYEELLDIRPQEVISRFENTKYARDKRTAKLYLTALYQTNNMDKVVPLLLSKEDSSSANGFSSSSLFSESIGTKERPIYVNKLPENYSAGKKIGTLLNVIIVGGIIYTLFMYNEPKLGGMSVKVHKIFKKKDKATSDVQFSDVQGCDEAKHELQEVVEFLKNPEKFNRLGAHMPKGVLLVGPPGTGKTMLAKAVAGEANVPFFYASGSEFDELFVGIGSMRIRQMFENAKAQSPAIIFIDEIDAVGSKRNARDPQHARMSLNQLLVELDGFSSNQGVVVIAATNFPETLDPALLRPGRFDKHVQVPLPDIRGRKNILKVYLKQAPCDISVDVDLLSKSTPGFSGADLAKLVNQAKIMASVDGIGRVTMDHLERSKDEMIMGAERKSAIISEEDRKLTAFHESGHAIVALNTEGAAPIHKATIMPRGNALGMVSQVPENDQLSLSKKELLSRLDVAMGGRVAEELIFGSESVTTGASSDFDQATKIARGMVLRFGMSEKVGISTYKEDELQHLSPEMKNLIDSEIKNILNASYARASEILTNRREDLFKLANALLDKETMSREEIEAVLLK